MSMCLRPCTGSGVPARLFVWLARISRRFWASRCFWTSAAAGPASAEELLGAGVAKEMIEAWQKDPQVSIDADGKMGSLFDQLEDMDFPRAVEKCDAINKAAA